MTFTFDLGYEERFREKVRDFNKRYSQFAGELQLIKKDEFVSDGKVNVVFDFSTPSLIVKRQNVSYIGSYIVTSGIPRIHTQDEDYSIDSLYKENWCDHCKSRRRRSKYFFFLEEGEVKQIGSSCVKEYFGIDLNKYFNSYEKLVSDITDELETDSYRDTVISLDVLVNLLYKVTNRWIVYRKGYDGTLSDLKACLLDDKVLNRYSDIENYLLTEEEKEDFRQFVIDNYKGGVSDYAKNVSYACLYGKDDNLKEGVVWSCIGLVASAFNIFRNSLKFKCSSFNIKEYREGDKISLSSTCTLYTTDVSVFGRWYLYVVDGTPLKFFSSKKLDTRKYQITGILTGVEKYTSYNGCLISKAKVI